MESGAAGSYGVNGVGGLNEDLQVEAKAGRETWVCFG